MLKYCIMWMIGSLFLLLTSILNKMLALVRPPVLQWGSSLKWTIHRGLTWRSKRLKVDGLWKWTVLKSISGRSERQKTGFSRAQDCPILEWLLIWFMAVNFGLKNCPLSSWTVCFGSKYRRVWSKTIYFWRLPDFSLKTVHFHPFGQSTLYLTLINWLKK